MSRAGARHGVPAVVLLACLLGPAPAGRAANGGGSEIVLTNRGSAAIQELYVSPSASDDWGTDRLGGTTLPPGRALRLRLGRMPGCAIDVQAVFVDGVREEQHRLDACRLRQIALGAEPVPLADAAATRDVDILNEAARPIQQVFVSPASAGDWGEDLLRDGSLSVGERVRLAYRGGCLADLRVVFDNRAAEERRGIDVCALGGVRIRPGWTTADALAPLPPPPAAFALTVTNRSGHAARLLRLAPSGAAPPAPPPDLLANAPLADGASLTVRGTRPADVCRFDARVEFADAAPPQDLRGLDLCRDATLTLLPQA